MKESLTQLQEELHSAQRRQLAQQDIVLGVGAPPGLEKAAQTDLDQVYHPH